MGIGRITHVATSPITTIWTTPRENSVTTPTPNATMAMLSARYPARLTARALRRGYDPRHGDRESVAGIAYPLVGRDQPRRRVGAGPGLSRPGGVHHRPGRAVQPFREPVSAPGGGDPADHADPRATGRRRLHRVDRHVEAAGRPGVCGRGRGDRERHRGPA